MLGAHRRLVPGMRSLRSGIALIAGVPVFLFRSHFRVHGDSMQPRLQHGDLLHVVPRSLTRNGYRRGSVVVVKSPARDDSLWVKRVVGLPGEFVEVREDGSVLIDDTPLREPYRSPAKTSGGDALPWLCDPDEYFLMGDNRSDSGDSRRYGPIPSDRIIGRVWLRWPLRRSESTQGATR